MHTHYGTFLQFYDCAARNFVARSFGRKEIVMFVAPLLTLVWYQSVISLEVVGTFLRQRREHVSIMQMPPTKLRYSFGWIIEADKTENGRNPAGGANNVAGMIPRQDTLSSFEIDDSDD